MNPETVNKLPLVLRKKLQQLIDHYIGDVLPAVTLAVIWKDEWILHAGWGWVDPETRQIPVTPTTLFDFASVTKLFTTTVFLSLVSEDKVALDDALVNVIPEFGQSGPRPIDGGQDPHTKEPLPTPGTLRGQMVDPNLVTCRHLLTHTSGIAPWRDVYRAAGIPPTPPYIPDSIPREERWSKALTAICTYPFVGQPDGIIRYSDLGLMLLGEATSRLHETPGKLEKAISDRVTNPLQLNSMTYNPVHNGHNRNNISPTEDDPTWRQRRCWGEVHDENACGVGGVAGHAGLFGNVHDIAAFGQAWLNHDSRLGIASELIHAATQEQAVTDDERRGLGWMLKSVEESSAGTVFSPESFGHTGFTGTSLWIDPKRQLVVACLTNRVYPGREKPGILAFRQALHNLLAEGLEN